MLVPSPSLIMSIGRAVLRMFRVFFQVLRRRLPMSVCEVHAGCSYVCIILRSG